METVEEQLTWSWRSGKTFLKEVTLKLRSEDERAVAKLEEWRREDWNQDVGKSENV